MHRVVKTSPQLLTSQLGANMRRELRALIDDSIIYKYDLPNHALDIDKSIFSNVNDKCFETTSNEDLATIIYNSIVDYSFNEFDIAGKELTNLQVIALLTKLKFNEHADLKSKISYGFHGETLLYCFLCAKYSADPVISRGYFYDPLESSETKGYDSYHIIEVDDEVELWFGEVKFRVTHSSGIKSALKNIDKALSDEYLARNLLSISNHKNNLNVKGSKVEEIINRWELNPKVSIINEVKKHNVKLVYPILIIYDKNKKGYDNSIEKAIEYIKSNYSKKKMSISIDFRIYFIFMPIDKVRDVKLKVIEWIKSNEPLI